MGAPMKTTAKAMSKGAIAETLAAQCELKKSVCAKVLGSLAEVATGEVQKTGVFTLPGLCKIKTRVKPHQGRQEGGLRQGGDGEGEAGTQGREGLPGEGPEGQRLSGCVAPSDVTMVVTRMAACCP